MAMKRVYGIKGWNGDPCLPRNYSWDALNCSDSPTPKIISLNLGGSGLSGRISAALEGLKEIQSLNLSNNSLTGTIPDVLSHLPKLVILDLRDNNLSGSVPRALLDKNNSQSLAIRIDGNPSLCSTPSCGQSRDSVQMGRNNHSQCPQAVIIVSIVGGIVIISAFFMLLLWKIRNLQVKMSKGKLQSPSEMNGSRAFAYSEVVLSSASRQGFKEFSAEVKLLMRVHHKNLAAFIGFCEEGNNMILIYEYMAKGNLQGILLDDHSSRVFNWEQRLQIALCAAQGLEYLHYGCKPPIIHRDVKTSNILLNERLEAKLADFGLSKAWANDGDTHISTVVVGTPGYVDPEYYITNKLNEKSDVYSFGIVLLELITGLPAIIVNEQRIHIIQWVTPNLVKGSIASIVDPRMQGQYDTSSMWKVAEIAMACTPHTGIKRPTMSDVVHELKGSLELEVARLKRISGKKSRSQSRNSSNLIQSNSQSVFYPLPR
ncbi:hypothetical protein AMTR_s00056p00191070 [Amborella trichopoda]|uniref:Protein kinase domain-containing protein n=1 Tax=Amborella trichopoda TaxID=13333 RepID=U5D4E9_AMBTC|nr:hypothetical protein AMTR_s00056p00191070 [Amborella trichopoda]